MTCIDAIREVFDDDPGPLKTAEVMERIYRLHPDRPWKEVTIRAHLMGLSSNHPSSVHYPTARRRAFLHWEPRGLYRLWNPDTDGEVPSEAEVVSEVPNETEEEAEFEGLDTSLSLESDLEKTLVSSLGQLESGLRMYSSPETNGRQYDTKTIGRIDLLAVDSDGKFVVIELKAGRAEDKTVSQLLRYMGWVKKELASGDRVRGLVVAHDFSESIKYAVLPIPEIKFKRYEVTESGKPLVRPVRLEKV